MFKSFIQKEHFQYTILLSLLVILFFGSTLNNGFVYDDEYFILRNKFVTSFKFLPDILTKNIIAGSDSISNLFRPVQGITHLIDVTIFGYKPWGHHLSNVIFHLLLALSLMNFLRTLFNPLASFIVTSLFIIHPIQVEAVAYISGRGDILGMIFLLNGILWFQRSLFVALFLAILSMLSKESFALFPALLTIHLFMKNKTYNLGRSIFLRTVPFWIISSIYVALRLTVLNFADTLNFYNSSNVFTDNFGYRLLTYITTLPKSFLLWIYPYDLHHERSWKVFTDPFLLQSFLSILFVALLIFLFFYFRKRNMAISLGIIWYMVATLPTSNLVFIIKVIFYDHWFIFPGLGLTIVIGSVLHKSKITVEPSLKKHVLTIFALILVAYFPLTFVYNLAWKNGKTLYTHILKFEKSSTAFNNLGMIYANEGDTDTATEYFKKSIEISDTGTQARYNLGRVYFYDKKFSNAKKHLLRAIEIDPFFKPSWTLLEKIFMLEGNRQAAKNLLYKFKQIHGIK